MKIYSHRFKTSKYQTEIGVYQLVRSIQSLIESRFLYLCRIQSKIYLNLKKKSNFRIVYSLYKKDILKFTIKFKPQKIIIKSQALATCSTAKKSIIMDIFTPDISLMA
jgi:hypothetical protein